MADVADYAVEATDVPRESFRAPVLRGLAWKTVSRALFEVTKLGVAVALARLLSPREYGLAGMALVLLAFQPPLSGLALASALVQRPILTEEDRSTAFWVNLATGLFFTLLGIALSGPAAAFYGAPEVRPLFAAMSLCYVVSALGITHSQLLVRAMDFRSMELRTMAGIVVGAVLAVGAAAAGFGAWALVVQPLAAFATSTVLLWILCDWHPHFVFSRQSLRELRGYAGNVFGTLTLFQLSENTDNVLIGRALGAQALGAYALAYNIILVPFSRLTAPLHDVLFPVFTRLQNDRERMAASWLRVIRMVFAVAVPSMLGLVVVAPDFVPVVFGAKWHAAIPVVQILAWVGILLALQGLNSMVFMAVGQTRLLLICATISFAGGLTSFLVGLQWGIVGVALCFAIWSTGMQLAYLVLAARAVGATAWQCIRALSGVVQAAVIAVAAVALVRHALLGTGIGVHGRLVVTALAGGAAYAAATVWRAREVLDELKRLRPGRARVDSSAAA